MPRTSHWRGPRASTSAAMSAKGRTGSKSKLGRGDSVAVSGSSVASRAAISSVLYPPHVSALIRLTALCDQRGPVRPDLARVFRCHVSGFARPLDQHGPGAIGDLGRDALSPTLLEACDVSRVAVWATHLDSPAQVSHRVS